MNMSRRICSTVLILFSSLSAQTDFEAVNRIAQEIQSDSILQHGQWGFCAAFATSGAMIADFGGNQSLIPASGLKLLTSAAALCLLGEDYTFFTYLEYDGEIDVDGTLLGNLYLRGAGDPSLGSDQIEGALPLDSLYQHWLQKIDSAGIRAIEGNIIGDDAYLDYMSIPDYFPWIHMGNYYGAGASGLTINDNLYHLYFKPGQKVGDPAEVLRTEPEIPGIQFFNEMKTGPEGSGDNGYIYAAPGQLLQYLRGTIPMRVSEFSIKGSIPDPAKFAAQHLASLLRQEGIDVTGTAFSIREIPSSVKPRILIDELNSPPLRNIIYRLNKVSFNLYAEQLLKVIGKTRLNNGSSEGGIKAVENWLTQNGLSMDGLFYLDGSGLSRSNAITPRIFVELLVFMSKQKVFTSYFNSLGIAGDPDDIGYMKNMCVGTAAAQNLRAKTGTILRVRSHSGYVRTRSGTLLCFSMIANNFTGSSRRIDQLHEKLMIALAELP
jgi:D-alanyl-D-alanine carboxypeptidase/D-alanyl-D-alanine-endopeptidase (penicillin-binding protein 4)